MMADSAEQNRSTDHPPAQTLLERADDASSHAGITLRSLLIGTLCVAIVCLVTPYNNFILSDTSLTAGFLPLMAVVIQFFLIVCVNAPLHRWAPTYALRHRELAIIVLMTLLACSLPDWGLMRFLIPTPVAPFYHGAGDTSFFTAFKKMGLPAWLFPVTDVSEGTIDPAAVWFYRRVPGGESIPWGAWIKPLAAWGIFIAAMLATLVSIGRMVLGQWLVNERLPFPLVQVQASLIEPPSPGKSLNGLLSSRGLWIGLGIVFCIHTINGVGTYAPGALPSIPLGYDFTGLFVDPPFSFLRSDLKKATLSFMVIGATYFIRARAAFSLWGMLVIVCLFDVARGAAFNIEPNAVASMDQHLGACVAFILGTAWIGRHHWMMILRNAFGVGESSLYRVTFFIAMLGITVMFTWLCWMQVQWWMAASIVAVLLMAHIVVSRIVAETGLPIYRSSVNMAQIYTNLPINWLGARDVYFAGVFNVLGSLTSRDGIMTMTQQGLGITRDAGIERRGESRLGPIIAWAIVLGCVCAAVSTIYCQYSYPTPLAREILPQGNNFGAVYVPKRDVIDPFMTYSSGRFPEKRHSPLLHMGSGFVITCLLEIASLRWASWPLLPVGFVTSYGAFMGTAWFSIFVGWIAKSIIVRFGGAKLMTTMRPLFVGMIFGEALAAALFLLINAIMVWTGHESQIVKFLV